MTQLRSGTGQLDQVRPLSTASGSLCPSSTRGKVASPTLGRHPSAGPAVLASALVVVVERHVHREWRARRPARGATNSSGLNGLRHVVVGVQPEVAHLIHVCGFPGEQDHRHAALVMQFARHPGVRQSRQQCREALLRSRNAFAPESAVTTRAAVIGELQADERRVFGSSSTRIRCDSSIATSLTWSRPPEARPIVGAVEETVDASHRHRLCRERDAAIAALSTAVLARASDKAATPVPGHPGSQYAPASARSRCARRVGRQGLDAGCATPREDG